MGSIERIADTEPSAVFVQISDSHIGPSEDYTHRGLNPYRRFEALLAALQELPVRPDFVIHTGDVCGDKERHAAASCYDLTARLLAGLDLPLYFAVGNHDDRQGLRRLNSGSFVPLSSEAELCYRFECAGFPFIVLDSAVTSKRAGRLSSKQLKELQRLLSEAERPLTILLHHPPVPLDSPWMDEHMLLANGAELHEVLCRRRRLVAGVFFGHVHQQLLLQRDGILYSSCPSSFFQFSVTAADRECRIDPAAPPGFQVIQIGRCGVRVNSRVVGPV